MKLSALSLFSGAGGMDIGVELGVCAAGNVRAGE